MTDLDDEYVNIDGTLYNKRDLWERWDHGYMVYESAETINGMKPVGGLGGSIVLADALSVRWTPAVDPADGEDDDWPGNVPDARWRGRPVTGCPKEAAAQVAEVLAAAAARGEIGAGETVVLYGEEVARTGEWSRITTGGEPIPPGGEHDVVLRLAPDGSVSLDEDPVYAASIELECWRGGDQEPVHHQHSPADLLALSWRSPLELAAPGVGRGVV